MKQWLLVIAILLCTDLVFCKTTSKNYRKKVSGWKKRPIKIPKALLDEFTNLPPEDYQFIKELDKQFKLHGNRLKIKIERDNSTSKTLKRNIDGDVGYGYQDVNHEQNYHFSPPRYMIYPYSQHNIPSAPASSYSGHQTLKHTIVDILPSKSFEIQENPVIYTSNQQHYVSQYTAGSDYGDYQHQSPTAPQYVQPIIVLRVPGPPKYASHLQSLLQQYIEIRAAQILREIEESENQQQHAEVNYQQHSYSQSSHDDEHHPQQAYFPPIDQVYHLRKQKPHQPQQPQEQIEHQPHVIYGPPGTPPSPSHMKQISGYDNGYHQSQDYEYETQTNANTYHHSASAYQYHIPVPVYVPEPKSHHHHSTGHGASSQSIYEAPMATMYDNEHHYSESGLKTSENNPRATHTRVHFTDAIKNDDHSTSYPLPSVTPQTRNLYLPPKEHTSYDQDNYQNLESEYQTEQAVVEITQRPFNYHAHRANLLSKARKRDAFNLNRGPQIQKFNKVIRRTKKHSTEKSFGTS